MPTYHLERDLEGLFQRLCKEQGALAFKLVATRAGLPDRMVVTRSGQILLVELKTPTGELSPIQKEVHSKLARRGVHVTVLYGAEQVRAWAQSLSLL